MDNYARLAKENLQRLYENLPEDLENNLPADKNGSVFTFPAFGKRCAITPDGISLDGVNPPGVIGILLSLYALHAVSDAPVIEPLRAFKEFPDSAPYVGAFASHTEQILVPVVERIRTRTDIVVEKLDGRPAPASVSGDFAFVVRPLPKIYLCYIFTKPTRISRPRSPAFTRPTPTGSCPWTAWPTWASIPRKPSWI